MANWHALSKELHIGAGWQAATSYPHAKQDALAPILMAEISHALSCYVLALAPNHQGAFSLNALLSVESGANLFLDAQDNWTAPYVPAVFRSAPFNLMSKESGEFLIAVDIDSPFFHTNVIEDHKLILDSDGQLSDDIQLVVEFMKNRVTQQKLTDELVAQLHQHGLVVEWPIEIQVGPEAEDVRKVGGLYCIDEIALKELEPQVLSELAKSGALALAYAQLLSQAKLQDLRARYAHFKNYLQPQMASAANELDLDKFFDGEGGADTFSF